MAANLVRSGVPLCAYNRSPGPSEALNAIGAEIVPSAADLFERCDTILLMLADDVATDAVLGRGEGDFPGRVEGRLVIDMATHSPDYSRMLERDILAAGGRFVEAPVSGSRGPAEAGALVAMVAGTADAVAEARPIIAAMCSEVIEVGAVPKAMAMKLAVNLYLITTVTALAEATRLASAAALDLAQFGAVIAKGPLGSSVAAGKLDKMARRDFSPQATISDVVKNARLVTDFAERWTSDAPLLRESLARFEAVQARGDGAFDMAAILTSYDEQTELP